MISTLLSFTPSLLAYRPFIDPFTIHQQWWLLLPPLALGISIVYKAVRMKDLTGYPRAVIVMTAQIVLYMFLLAVASYLLIMLFAKFIAAHYPG